MNNWLEEATDKNLVKHLRAVRHEDGFLNMPLFAEVLARLLERKNASISLISPRFTGTDYPSTNWITHEDDFPPAAYKKTDYPTENWTPQ